MKYTLFALLSLTVLTACSDLERVEVKDANGVVTERYSRRKSDYAREGKFEKFSASGIKVQEANYANDLLEGQRTIFWDNGKPQYIEHYRGGQFEGVYQAFHENGKMKLEGHYVAGEMTGTWKGYYDNGQLKEVVNFEQNQENGPFTEYYPDGKLKAEGAYLDGDNEHGELKLYDSTGTLTRRMMCDRGICHTVWQADTTQTTRIDTLSTH
jgi:antitoxin component YwqK of YwqJK toxin-antitoxin module